MTNAPNEIQTKLAITAEFDLTKPVCTCGCGAHPIKVDRTVCISAQDGPLAGILFGVMIRDICKSAMKYHDMLSLPEQRDIFLAQLNKASQPERNPNE